MQSKLDVSISEIKVDTPLNIILQQLSFVSIKTNLTSSKL